MDFEISTKFPTPEKYFVISSDAKTNGEKIELTSKQKFTKDEEAKAKALCDEIEEKMQKQSTGSGVSKMHPNEHKSAVSEADTN